MKFLIWLFSAFLYLYPVEFRKAFAAEMQADFLEALQAAAAEGWFAMLRLFASEIADLPGNLIHLHWTDRDPFPFDRPRSDSFENIAGTRRAGLLAGLPHLLYPLSLFLPLITSAGLGLPVTARPAQFTFWFITAVVLVFAWSRGWPRWSSSWIGYALVFALEQFNAIGFEGWGARFVFIIWLVLTGFTLLRMSRRDWLSCLLVILPVTPMWLWWTSIPATEGILAKAMLFASIGVSVFVAVAAVVRIGRWQTAALMLLAVLLAVGLPAAPGAGVEGASALLVYLGRPSNAPDLGISQFFILFLLTAPLWMLAVWRNANRQQQRG